MSRIPRRHFNFIRTKGTRFKPISHELALDLGIEHLCRVIDNRFVCWYLIDRRRLARELRKLPKIAAAAAARWKQQMDDLRYMRVTYGAEYYYTRDGRAVSGPDLLRVRELVDAALVRSIQPIGSSEITGTKPGVIIIDDLMDPSIDQAEFKRRALAWWDEETRRVLEGRHLPVADMLRRLPTL